MLKSLFGSRQEYTAIAQNKKNDTSPENIEMTNGDPGSIKFAIIQKRKEKTQAKLDEFKNIIKKDIFDEMDSPEKIIEKFACKEKNFIKLGTHVSMSSIFMPSINDVKIIIQQCVDEFNQKYINEITGVIDYYDIDDPYISSSDDKQKIIKVIVKFTLL